MKSLNELKKRAQDFHNQGNNCSQSTFLTFCDLVDIDKKLGFSLMEGFGGGMGNKMGTCGALSGVVAIVSLLLSSGDVNNLSKNKTYEIVSKLSDEFNQKTGSIYCYKIKGLDKKDNTPLISCDDAILVAVELAYNTIIKEKLA